MAKKTETAAEEIEIMLDEKTGLPIVHDDDGKVILGIPREAFQQETGDATPQDRKKAQMIYMAECYEARSEKALSEATVKSENFLEKALERRAQADLIGVELSEEQKAEQEIAKLTAKLEKRKAELEALKDLDV